MQVTVLQNVLRNVTIAPWYSFYARLENRVPHALQLSKLCGRFLIRNAWRRRSNLG